MSSDWPIPTKLRCKLQRGCYTHATCLATSRKVESRSAFLAPRNATIAVANGVLQVGGPSCNMAFTGGSTVIVLKCYRHYKIAKVQWLLSFGHTDKTTLVQNTKSMGGFWKPCKSDRGKGFFPGPSIAGNWSRRSRYNLFDIFGRRRVQLSLYMYERTPKFMFYAAQGLLLEYKHRGVSNRSKAYLSQNIFPFKGIVFIRFILQMHLPAMNWQVLVVVVFQIRADVALKLPEVLVILKDQLPCIKR